MTSALEKDLKDALTGEVRFSDGDRALYSADASNYRRVPLGAVIPKTVEEIATTVDICAKHGVPIVHRGGGTSLAGQTSAHGAIVIDSSKHCSKIISLDPEKKLAVVEPGVVLDDLRGAANKHGLTFGPDPSTHNHNTLGGMLGNNSCGIHSVEANRTSDNVHSLEIQTYDGQRVTVGQTSDRQLELLCTESGRVGEIYRGLRQLRDAYADEIRLRYPQIPRRVSGYNLDELLPEKGFHVGRALVSSESTCVSILHATIKLIPDPPFKLVLVVGYEDIVRAADAVPEYLPYKKHGLIALEAMDDLLLKFMREKKMVDEDKVQMLPDGNGWLFAQIGAWSKDEAHDFAASLERHIRHNKYVKGHKLLEGKMADALWDIRKGGLGATVWIKGMKDTWEGWEDSAVHPDELGAYIRDLRDLYKKYDYHGSMYGHFGDGLIHTRTDSGLHTEEEVRNWRSFMEEAAGLIAKHGGSLSGEHGDGTSRAELLPIMFGPKIIKAFEEFKHIWDPRGKMNPDKIVFPKRLDEDLRYGPQQKQKQFETFFNYPESDDSFARTTMRCVGIGECRKHDIGTMCPSYMATREEKHSTRGRARLFQEMVAGDPIRDGWKSDAIHEALDLCLSCKGCKKECPTQVDMAVWRAEFLYHFFKGKLRPLTGYTMGLVHVWAPLASRFSGLFNFLTQTPGLSTIAKFLGGVHAKRPLPKLAPKSFTDQWRPNGKTGKVRAILWADTFNNYFTPQPLVASAKLLEACGYEVVLPKKKLCCGRPFYDYGRLDEAKTYLGRCLDALAPMLDERTYLVGIEPSCLSVFREEMGRLFPNDERAKKLAERTLTLAAFLKKFGMPETYIPQKIMVHGHCHHKSVLKLEDEIDILRQVSQEVEVIDSGCCGMAGAFGYEKHKYAVSETIAEQRLMPAVRQQSSDTIILADGFSCRNQINNFAHRQPITMPELLLKALKGNAS